MIIFTRWDYYFGQDSTYMQAYTYMLAYAYTPAYDSWNNIPYYTPA